MASADELRRRREDESAFAFLYDMARERDAQLAAEGRRPFLGGLLSVGNFGAGADKMDVLRDIDFEGVGSGLLGLLSPVARAIDAPISAYRGTIPQEDMLNEAMNVTGMAMAGGGAIASPQGALASNALRSAKPNDGIVMAQRILDMRAAGRASEVTDEMMAQADPQYMFANTPLPMDEAARMARAEAAGFGGDLYHGTAAEDGIDAFDIGQAGSVSQQPNERAVFLTENPQSASWFANYAHPDGELVQYSGAGEGAVLPVVSRGNNDARDFRGQEYRNDWMADAIRSAQDRGADGLNIIGMRENFDGFKPIDNQKAIFNPANIRSRFARFDPEFAHLANLNAANASTVGGLLAQSGVSDKQAEKIETYLKKVGLLQ